MDKPQTKRKDRKMAKGKKTDIYQMITDGMIEKLEEGIVPWQKPWASHNPWPMNISSKRAYRGINTLILYLENMAHGYNSPYWLTFNQAKKVSGYEKKGRFWKWAGKGKDPKYGVRKGEIGTRVVFWKFLDVDDPEAPNGKRRIPLLRYYTVFNVDQCDLPEKFLKKISIDKREIDETTTIEKAEKIVAGYEVNIEHGGDRAFYNKKDDFIRLPKKTRFASDAEYYATLFHEMIHSTGSKERLNRETLVDAVPFGDNNYSKEELVAEMGAMFLAAEAGINLEGSKIFDNSAAYLKNWLDRIKEDSRLLIQAAGKAQKAVDFILGKTFNTEDE